MGKCEICGTKNKVVFKCGECGTFFCERCGNKDRLLCKDCTEYEEQAYGTYRLEQETEIGSEEE